MPPGQENDVLARVLERRLGEGWGQQVLFDNRTGGGTVIGTDIVAKAAPDGYTLLHVITPYVVNPTLMAKLPYDTLKDLTCVTYIGNLYAVLVAHPSLPVKNVKELIALARAQPGKLVYATGPVGNSSQINTESLRLAAGIDIAPVHYKGAGPAMQDLIAGRVPLGANVVLETLPYIRSGKVKPIAVISPKRSPSLPDVPAVGESLPNYQAGTGIWALLTRAGTPEALIKQLNADVVRAMQAPEVKERLVQMDIEAVGSTPAQCDGILREQIAVWGKIVKATGTRVE